MTTEPPRLSVETATVLAVLMHHVDVRLAKMERGSGDYTQESMVVVLTYPTMPELKGRAR